MANYEHTTLTQLRDKVYQKLGEDGVFWPTTEIDQNIEEALLTFGAIADFWKFTVELNTEENKRIYDLFTDTITGQQYIKPSLKYQKVVDWLNKDLLENLSSVTPQSEFLDMDTFLKAVETKYNLFQQLTNLVLSVVDIPVQAQKSRINLPENLIDIVRVAYLDLDSIETILDEADEQEIGYFSQDDLSREDTPRFYANVYGNTKELNLYPTPANNGILRVIFVCTQDTTNPVDLDTIINLPNNLVPYIKYGVEADIYAKDGVLNDVARAAYCKQRWDEGILMGRNYTSALLAKATGILATIDSLNNIDLWFEPEKVRYAPRVFGFAGFNIFITDIIPAWDVHSMQIFVNSNAQLPANDNDFIRIDKEYIDMLAGYVVHICMQKSGIAEIAATNDLKNNFLQTALNHNQRLQFKGITFDTNAGLTKKQEKEQNRIPKQEQ